MPTPPQLPSDSIDALIAQRLPDWLVATHPDRIRALHKALEQQERLHRRLQPILAAIPALDAFAQPLLEAELRGAGVQVDDVRRSTVTVKYKGDSHPAAPQSLLAAALHNYHLGETRPASDRQGWLQDPQGNRLPLGFEAFAGRCRALDIGQRYQAELERHLGAGDASGKASAEVRTLFEERARVQLECAVRMALAKAELDEPSYLHLLPVMSAAPVVPALPDTVTARQLYVLGKCVQGAMTFEVCSPENGAVQGVIAFFPELAVRPVQRHDSWQALYDWLSGYLSEREHRDFFARFILERDRPVFYTTLHERLQRLASGELVDLDARNLAISGDVFAHVRGLQVAKLFDDARVLAKPTGDEDQEDRLARIRAYESLALNVLGLAGMFVPVLGEVMMTVFAVQMADEVYEGYEDWRIGDRQGALGHLFGVAENIAAGLLIGKGVSIGMRVLDRLWFVDNLVPVAIEGGQVKLCASELPGYGMTEEQARAYEGDVPDDQWLVHVNDKLYRIRQDPASGSASVRHPLRDQASAPQVERNGSGGWRHALESPQHWQGFGYMLRRLSSRFTGLTDDGAAQLAQATGFDEPRLRALHLENAPAPARLLDAFDRQQLHEQFVAQDGTQLASRFAERQPIATAHEQVLQRDFPGLSVRDAREIVTQATGAQVDELVEQRRVPLALAEQARWQIREGRLDRACASLRLPRWANEDSEHLALGVLEELLPWPDTVGLELREGTDDGELLARQGNEDAGQVRVIVRLAEGYRLKGSTVVSQDVVEPLAQCLDSNQQALLQPGSTFTVQALRERLAEAASSDRPRAARLLGMVSSDASMRPLRRFGDGRMGYALSGRGESSRQSIKRGIHQIFPTLSDTQMQDYLHGVMARGEGLWTHFSSLQDQLMALRRSLEAWRGETDNLLEGLRRRRVATQFRRSWRRKVTNFAEEYVLEIDGERVSNLPTLPEGVDFAHVRRLTLRNMALEQIDESLLARFPNLVELDLRGNRLTQVPRGLERMTQLGRLYLSRNRLVLDSQSERRLAAMSHLQLLDLNFNPLGRAPDLTALRHLRELRLRGTHIETLPDRVSWRAHVDFRENQIRSVRQDLAHLRQRVERLFLHDNPLDEQSSALVDLAAGVSDAGARGSMSHEHGKLDDAIREQWLGGASAELRSRRTRTLNALSQEPDSAGLLRFLSDFTRSAEFAERPGDYRARIWEILGACEQHERVRQRVFQEVAQPRTCEDRELLILEQLELSVLVERATNGFSAAEEERGLIRLARSLYRLDEVDSIAARHVARMHRDGTPLVDEVEVRLFYRLKLRATLDLPLRADEMHYASYANVTTSDLLRARSDVLAAHDREREITALGQRPFWEAHVRARYADRLQAQTQAIVQRQEQNEADLEKNLIDEWTYVNRSKGFMYEFEAAERQLIKRLAREVYERLTP
jgi:Leucine-rich repeat (LRR) protein